MIFRQLVHDDLGCASYLIGDENAGVAAVVDPKLDIDPYLQLARYLGVHIEHILETHNHADHVSGHGRLVAATGARIHIHRDAEPGLRPRALRRRLGAPARPAHGPRHPHARPPPGAHGVRAHRERPQRRALGRAHRRQPLRRRHRAARPRGRQARGRARHLPLAQRQADEASRHVRGLARAPRRLALRRAGHEPQGLVDDRVRAREPAAAPGRRRGRVRARGPPPPSARSHRTSRTSSRSTGARSSRTRSTPTRSPRARCSRPSATARWWWTSAPSFSSTRRIFPGAVCITARRAGFGSKLAWLAEHDQPLVLVGRDDEDAREAAVLASAVGLSNVAGYLAGGMTAWREEREPVDRVDRLDGRGAPRSLGRQTATRSS